MATDILSDAAGTSRRRKITPPELARRWGIDKAKVVKWIRSGELRAIDGSTRRGSKPRYLIDLADIRAFEQAREVKPAIPQHRGRRARRPAIREYV